MQQSGLERLGRKRERANKYQVPLCLAAPTYPHWLICEDCMISPSTSAPLYPFSSTAIFFFFSFWGYSTVKQRTGRVYPPSHHPPPIHTVWWTPATLSLPYLHCLVDTVCCLLCVLGCHPRVIPLIIDGEKANFNIWVRSVHFSPFHKIITRLYLFTLEHFTNRRLI